MQKDMKTMLSALPPTLEVLQMNCLFLPYSSDCDGCLLPVDLDELDGMLAAIPDRLCPRLRSLGIDTQNVLHFCRVCSGMPLSRFIAACKKRSLLLTLGREVAFGAERGNLNFMHDPV